MNYLLINEYRELGGSEVQSLRERDMLRANGHIVMYLTFDPKFPLKTDGLDVNIPLSYSGVSLFYHRVFVSNKLKSQLMGIIENFEPDVIHLNNTIAAASTVYACLAQFNTFQTIRDYSAVCPKDTCVHADWTICRGYCHGSCFSCIGNDLRHQIKNLCLRFLSKQRVDSIDRFVCPSSALAKCCSDNKLPTDVLNNPFDFSIVKKTDPYFDKTYLYYGSISERKGVSSLLHAWRTVVDVMPDAHLLFVGRVVDEYNETFQAAIESMQSVSYLGMMTNAEIMDLYKHIYCVIVPSLWIENYPNTVLEALANKTLVLGSNRGGIPELIQNKDFLFDVLNEASIADTLKRSYELPEDDYVSITENAYNRCREQNSLESYYERLMVLCDSFGEGRKGK